MNKSIDQFMESLISKNPEQIEFHQAVKEVIESIWSFLQENPQYMHANILDRIVEPERVITFRVPWVDDQKNAGYAVRSVGRPNLCLCRNLGRSCRK